MESAKRLSASSEDYLEAIYNLLADGQVARSKDIAESLSVSRASVTGALKLLSDKGLVNYKPYSFITLTARGMQKGRSVAEKHKIIESFFRDVLNVNEKSAEKAACRAEHALGNDVMDRLADFNDFINSLSSTGKFDIRTEFSRFLKKKENTNGR